MRSGHSPADGCSCDRALVELLQCLSSDRPSQPADDPVAVALALLQNHSTEMKWSGRDLVVMVSVWTGQLDWFGNIKHLRTAISW